MMSNKLLKALVFVIIVFIYCTSTYTEAKLINSESEHDSRGYIMYCPCMGRFGNQAEQLLGSLLFAKSLNRTLLLPPFIHYGLGHVPVLEPFENIIQVEPIKEYHNVMLLTDFMTTNAKKTWPPGSRQFYCYSSRDLKSDINNFQSCDALKGQPFNAFWSFFNISEEASIIYKPLSTNPNLAQDWARLYPAEKHPVLTFVGAPSPFPTHRDAIKIQKHIKLSKYVEIEALKFKSTLNYPNEPYLSIHIRHGIDWKKACELLKNDEHGRLKEFFSSNQCTGYNSNETTHKENLEYDTCFPSFESISSKLKSTLDEYKMFNNNNTIKLVHIATDHDDAKFLENLKSSFPIIEFFTTPRTPNTILGAMIDIYLMANSDIFIGNCISSFSAFPARIRTEQLNLVGKTYYFGQIFRKHKKRDEL